jgi:hypothetical protein
MNIPGLEFTHDGHYDLSTPSRRLAAAEAMLRIIATTPIAYYSRGPEWCRDEMARLAGEAASLLEAARRDRL